MTWRPVRCRTCSRESASSSPFLPSVRLRTARAAPYDCPKKPGEDMRKVIERSISPGGRGKDGAGCARSGNSSGHCLASSASVPVVRRTVAPRGEIPPEAGVERVPGKHSAGSGDLVVHAAAGLVAAHGGVLPEMKGTAGGPAGQRRTAREDRGRPLAVAAHRLNLWNRSMPWSGLRLDAALEREARHCPAEEAGVRTGPVTPLLKT